MSDVKPTLYAPIRLEIDVDARRGTVDVPGLVESKGTPITNPFTGGVHGVSISLDEGFEYNTAKIGRGDTKATAGLSFELNDGYGQFSVLHMTQDGVVR